MRPEPIALTSTNPFVLFVETASWFEVVGTELENHFFARRRDRFWDFFQRHDIGLLDIKDGEPLTALDDEEIHEVAKYDFTFYVSDTMDGAKDVTKWDRDIARVDLLKLIWESKPRMLCFTAMRDYIHFTKKYQDTGYGLQSRSFSHTFDDITHSVEVFVLPSTINTPNVKDTEEQEKIWSELYQCVSVMKKRLMKKKT